MAGCLPCLGAKKRSVPVPPPPVEALPHHRNNVPAAARTFSFEELAAATRGFSDAYLVAGKDVYKAHVQSVNQVVAMKRQHVVNRNGSSVEQLSSEFLARVLMLNALRHPNLVGLIGFCSDGSHRILVHEYMTLGSLEDHLHDPSTDDARLEWSTRMNIAVGVARALEYLQEKGVVYGLCLQSSDVLLGEGYHPKLSLYGLTKVGQLPDGHDETHLEAMGGLAPETATTGRASAASNVYSFGALLLEMITGRRAFSLRDAEEDPNIVTWARPLLQDRAEFRRMADPALQGRYPSMDLEEALTVASMCIHQRPARRSPIGAVVTALARLAYHQPS